MKCKAILAVVAILPFSAWAAMDYYSSHTTQSYIGKVPSQLPEPKSTSITFSSDLLNLVASHLSAGSFDPERNSTAEDTNQKHSYTIELPLLHNDTEIRQSQRKGVQITEFVDLKLSAKDSPDESREEDPPTTPYMSLMKKVKEVYPKGTTFEFHESTNDIRAVIPGQSYAISMQAPKLEMDDTQSFPGEPKYPVALRDISLELLLLAGSCDASEAPGSCPYGEFVKQGNAYCFSRHPEHHLPAAPIIVFRDETTGFSVSLAPDHQLSFIPGMNPKVTLIGDPVQMEELSDKGNGSNRGARNQKSLKSARTVPSQENDKSKAGKKKKGGASGGGGGKRPNGTPSTKKEPSSPLLSRAEQEEAEREAQRKAQELEKTIQELTDEVSRLRKSRHETLKLQAAEKRLKRAKKQQRRLLSPPASSHEEEEPVVQTESPETAAMQNQLQNLESSVESLTEYVVDLASQIAVMESSLPSESDTASAEPAELTNLRKRLEISQKQLSSAVASRERLISRNPRLLDSVQVQQSGHSTLDRSRITQAKSGSKKSKPALHLDDENDASVLDGEVEITGLHSSKEDKKAAIEIMEAYEQTIAEELEHQRSLQEEEEEEERTEAAMKEEEQYWLQQDAEQQDLVDRLREEVKQMLERERKEEELRRLEQEDVANKHLYQQWDRRSYNPRSESYRH